MFFIKKIWFILKRGKRDSNPHVVGRQPSTLPIKLFPQKKENEEFLQRRIKTIGSGWTRTSIVSLGSQCSIQLNYKTKCERKEGVMGLEPIVGRF